MHQIFHKNSILLTGVTGFLGKRLLAELLEQRRQHIICLVRADSEQAAIARGRAISSDPLVTFVQADLEQAQLGMPVALHRRLANVITEIFHCAASVRFDLPLAEAERINVGGTQQMLELARQAKVAGGFNRFHHVSTAYVAGTRVGAVTADYLPDDAAGHYRNSYERTKARAERILRSQGEVSVSIYRPSIVAGDSVTGRTCNWNVLYVPMRMIVRGQLPVLRKGGCGLLDCVGVDYVARGIVALAAADSSSAMRAFHLTTGSSAFNMQHLAQCSVAGALRGFPQSSVRCQVISPWRWSMLRQLAKHAKHSPRSWRRLRTWGVLVTRGMASFAPYEPYTEVDTVFDNSRETALLAAAGIAMPDWSFYLNRIVDYAISANFGVGAGSKAAAKSEVKPEVKVETPLAPLITQELAL